MTNQGRSRTYQATKCVSFRTTKAEFGGLSNMASGFPLEVNGIRIPTSEALYQACRFPHRPDLQRLIIEQRSPMTAKMKSKSHRKESRPDWDEVRIRVMRWCLRVKLAQNIERFGHLLLVTGARPIVESSRTDVFWGAKISDDGTFVGINALGRLLMELREEFRNGRKEEISKVEPLDIPHFLLYEEPVGVVEACVPKQGYDPDTVSSGSTDESPLLRTGQTVPMRFPRMDNS